MTLLNRHRRRTLFITMLAIVALACEEEEPVAVSPVLGRWVLTDMTVTATTTDTVLTELYVIDNISNAFIIEFEESLYDIYSDDLCRVGWNAESENFSSLTYAVQDDHFLILNQSYSNPGSSVVYTTSEPLEYELDGELLTLILRVDDVDAQIVQRMELELYPGDIPPAEWGITLAADVFEPDTTMNTATPLEIGAVAQTHTLPLNDYDIFSINADSGQTYAIETTGALDTYLSLYDSLGTTLLTDDDDGGESLNARIVWTSPTTATYLIRANAYDPTEECGTYSITAALATTSKRIDSRQIDKAMKRLGILGRR